MIEYAANMLNETYPLDGATHQDVCQYRVVDGQLSAEIDDGSSVGLASPEQFLGYTGDAADPSGILLKHNGLHMEIQIDREDSVGKGEKAGVKDVLVESAQKHY